MRIISGNFKGKKLFIPEDENTRPLKDNVKESIFNILEHSKLISYSLNNSKILDLFSGVGSFGLECISRKSSHVTFFENYNPALKILKRNIKALNCYKKTEIIEEDIFNLENIKIKFKNYEFIFLDPPYKERRLSNIIDNIFQEKILNKDGVIIVHRHKRENDEFSKNFRILDEKKYGISKIIFGNLN